MIFFQLLNMQADILVKYVKDLCTILEREMLAKGDAVHLIIYPFTNVLSISKKNLHKPIENDWFFVREIRLQLHYIFAVVQGQIASRKFAGFLQRYFLLRKS